GGVVLTEELRLHKSPLVLELGIAGIDFALGLGNQHLVDHIVLPLENQEVRSVYPHILPAAPAVPVALDLKLGQRPVTVIVDLQPQSFHLREGEYLIQEILFKGAVSMVGQIVEGVILLGVGGILLSE